MASKIKLITSLCLLLIIAVSRVENAAQSLPAYNVNTDYTSVSGLSSGGYMAVQMHVAFSSMMIGAGVLAGGPYNCAEGALSVATTTCMNAIPAPNTNTYIQTTNSRSSSGTIDNVSNLASQRIYLFSGTKDTTVKPAVMNSLEEYYANYVASQDQIYYENTLTAAHTYPTVFQLMNNCGVSMSPYISYCGYDGAGYALNHIFDYKLNPRSAELTGQIISFDQSEFYSGNINSISMDDTGYAYVPKDCAQGASCYVHVAFHGCLQAYENIGMDFVNYAGYNEWAETNSIIVLYPQTISTMLSNPNACWDWWGYTGRDYDQQSGAQMQVIKAMIDRVGGNFASFLTAPTLSLIYTTDNSISFEWTSVDNAYDYSLYRNGKLLDQVTSLNYNDTSVASGSTYEYVVAAATSVGQQGPFSNTLIASTSGTPPPLSAPSSLSATEISSTSVVLVWEYVEGATEYNVYRDDSLVGSASQNTYTDLSLSPSTTYTYTLTAQNAAGSSSPSNPLSITTNSAFTCSSYTANNYEHVMRGRAYVHLGITYANGSDEYMGLYNIFVYNVLSETSPNYYVIGTC